MTCILAYRDDTKNSMIMGADSFVGKDGMHNHQRVRDGKVLRGPIPDSPYHYMMGFTGYSNLITHMKHGFRFPSMQGIDANVMSSETFIEHFVYEKVMPEMKKVLEEKDALYTENGIKCTNSIEAILCVNQHIMLIGHHLTPHFYSDDDILAVGSGEDYALAYMEGALAFGGDKTRALAFEAVLASVQYAGRYVKTVCDPYTVKQYRVILPSEE